MDHVGAGLRGHRDHGVDVEVVRHANGHVGGAYVRRRAVQVGVERDRAQAQAASGAEDAQRDLAAVGDQDRSQGERGGHRDHILKTP